jgi:hypothetical protein
VRDSSTNIDLSRDDELKSRISFRPDEALSDKARGRIMEMLGSLFELLSSSANATEIETAACEFVARWVRADRVVMLEDDGEGTELRQKANWAAKPTRDKLRLSSSITSPCSSPMPWMIPTSARTRASWRCLCARPWPRRSSTTSAYEEFST